MDKVLESIIPFLSSELAEVVNKILLFKRISEKEGLLLFEKADLGLLGMLAMKRNHELNGDKVFFNKNFHIEPSNECRYHCKFCSYRKDLGLGYTLSKEQILKQISDLYHNQITEVHIVGSAHPDRGVAFYADLLRDITSLYPTLHIKAFSAVEIHNMSLISKISIADCLKILKEAGLGSLPGGGAEILNDSIRKLICADKTDSQTWLDIHQTAHNNGIASNATILYGHVETYAQRIEHLVKIRNLQDVTHGFNAFIPLKYLNKNNNMRELGQVSIIEDMKNYAISRIFLDNIPHIKAYWPMLGKEEAAMSLYFGVDDMDGTIDDTTAIYTTAGAKEQSPKMSSEEMVQLIKQNKRIPVERDSLYREIKIYND